MSQEVGGSLARGASVLGLVEGRRRVEVSWEGWRPKPREGDGRAGGY
jgi:hypothetical protein